jgi:hypothetical protein
VSSRTRQTVTDTLPELFPDLFVGASTDALLESPPLTPKAGEQIRDLLASGDIDAWSEALARVGSCAAPIRLHGSSETLDTTTGEILSTYASAEQPLGVTHVRCGNRRAAASPSCARTDAADMFHLVRAGVTGGKGVPESVAENPLVFACRPWVALSARPATRLRTDPTRGRPAARAAAVQAGLRLRHPGGLAVVGTRPRGGGSPSHCTGWSLATWACPPVVRERTGARNDNRGIAATLRHSRR